jgi:general secretion pathway protein J
MRLRGFTLIEVMIAMFIAAIMFAIGYGAINQALRDRESLNVSQARVTEIQRGMRVVAQDFAQMSDRPARDITGTGQLMPAVSGDARNDTIIIFSRNGWRSRGNSAAGRATRALPLVEGSLVREHWLSVDPALNAGRGHRCRLRASGGRMRFLDPISRQWSRWPVAAPARDAGQCSPADDAPAAIEFTVVFRTGVFSACSRFPHEARASAESRTGGDRYVCARDDGAAAIT